MYKKNLIKKSKIIQYFDQKEIGSIPRIFISSLLLILFFYSMPLIINYANNKDTAFENKSKQVLAYTLNNGSSSVESNNKILDEKDFQYLYNDDMGYHFMNCSTYEQISLSEHLINAPEFLKDEIICQILFHAEEERPLSCELPTHIEAEVTYTEPGVRGDTATNTLKPAKIDTGVEIRVPLFINTGDFIKVDTRNKEYTERVKK